MKNPTTLVSSMNYSKGLANKSNECEVLLFLHLQAISLQELWTKDSFYVGSEELIGYKDKVFSALMYDIFNRSTTWFTNMDIFLKYPNGRSLYIQHGHVNMVCYKSLSPEHRTFILKVAGKRPVSSFYALLASAGLRGRKVKDIKPEKQLLWEKKHKTLEKKYNALMVKYTKVKEENKVLVKKINKIDDMIKSS
ncbi:MAG: hypothetical protein P9L97_05680 [Candidatus Tenebribacter davisii]|nr:hypothetical protein [Candidatus Tenebribacter davisii]